jgi:hypothetical protein
MTKLLPYVTPHVCPLCGRIANPYQPGHDPGCAYGK